ncbi:MAG: hypothetical protein LBN07_04430 [Christensenellaceae bacterium]|jgi:hypothetical protein|nr:hypothetical protein [Christensenellaceae bacterium]
MKKMIILEGLPGVGKTTLLQKIKERNIKNIFISNELIHPLVTSGKPTTEDFMQNDDMKMQGGNCDFAVVDRGPISTLSYNQTKRIVDLAYKFNLSILSNWFSRYIPILQSEKIAVYYLINSSSDYYLRRNKNSDPHGTVENQKLMENISLFNCKKYVKNLIIKSYNHKNIAEVADEIINQLMRP